jgi:hypothetical protein
LFNSADAIEVNRKLLIYKKLKEQQEEIKIREQIQEAERHKIDQWWEEEQKKIVPWTVEQKAFYTKFTFSPDEKTNEAWIRSKTNEWKKLENR